MSDFTTPPAPQTNLVGESPAFQAMLAHVSALAPLNRPVLIIGERGTGKEIIANRLKFLSPRWNRPYLTLNCGALSDGVLDSELFGHEAGAFTGATRRRASRFEAADTGTLFLDEIGNAPPSVQEKLLRVIEYGSFERVGGNETVHVDVRLIAATNADLPALAESGKFRADLLDRLAFDVINIPPLRDRAGDILILATHFATRMTAELGRDLFPGFAQAAEATLTSHPWPGNVRELRNAVERSLYRHPTPTKPLSEIILDPFSPSRPSPPTRLPPSTRPSPPTRHARESGHPLPPPPTPTTTPPNFREAVDTYERHLLTTALTTARHNQKQAAAALHLTYSQFRNALKKHLLP
jgi:psp operon transcriptional activator